MTDDRTSPLGRAIHAERTRQNLTRQAVCAAAGIAEPSLARIELYAVVPSVETLTAIAGALGVPVSRLLGESSDGEPVERPTSDPVERATTSEQAS